MELQRFGHNVHAHKYLFYFTSILAIITSDHLEVHIYNSLTFMCVCVRMCVCTQLFSHIQLFVTPWTVTCW